MPIYEYRCEKGHTFEVMQRMADDALTECTVCGKPVQRVFHPIAVHFKGSGFYNTDYGKKTKGATAPSSDGGDSGSSSSSDSSSEGGGSDSGSSSKGSDKPKSKPDSSSSSGGGDKKSSKSSSSSSD